MAPRRKFDLKFKETVLQYAEKTSGEQAARHFNIDPKRIRDWRKQRAELLSADGGRARLSGGGRKKLSTELEDRLSRWIHCMRDKQQRVSRSMIICKALEIYPSVREGGRRFVASRGWLQRFLQRNERSIQPKKDQNLLSKTLAQFVNSVGKIVHSEGILEEDIIAMDEMSVCFEAAGVNINAGHEKNHLTVVLAARADGTKLTPYIVLGAAAGGVQGPVPSAVIVLSLDGRMSDALTVDWLQLVVGTSSSTQRLLVWDADHCHLSAPTQEELKRGYNVSTAVIPSGCTAYIHPPEVMWRQPFQQSLRAAHSQWLSEAAAGRAPLGRMMVDWVVAAWEGLDQNLIRESFKACGLSVNSDGSEDNLILYFREGHPCAAGRDTLRRLRQNQAPEEEDEDEEEEGKDELFYMEPVDFDEGDFREEDDDDFMSSLSVMHQASPSNLQHGNVKEEQQERSSCVDQGDSEPTHIKEEQEELWSSQEGNHLPGLDKADIIKFKFDPVTMKSEEDGEKPQSSQLHQRQSEHMQTGAVGEAEAVRTEESSETEDSDED